MIRTLDIVFSFVGLIVLSPVLLTIILALTFEKGSPIFGQVRMGLKMRQFKLYKFRTMSPDTLDLPSHLVDQMAITKIGRVLRQFKFDELPQLFNVLLGDMSLVGPRPNLITQKDVILERQKLNIYGVRPGITGLSQIQKIDMSNPQMLAENDSIMIKDFSVMKYFKYILLTLVGRGYGDAASRAD